MSETLDVHVASEAERNMAELTGGRSPDLGVERPAIERDSNVSVRAIDLDERLRRLCQEHKFRPTFISIQIQGLSEEGQKVEQDTSFF